MMDLREMITEEEFKSMDNYRDMYAFTDCTDTHGKISMKSILATWSSAKQDLFELFGKKLILTKEIEYNKSTEELMEELDRSWNDSCTPIGYFVRNMYEFMDREFPSYYWNESSKFSEKEKILRSEIRSKIYGLFSTYTLSNNKYENENGNFVIPTPDGKGIQVSSGSKAMKLIGKIATAYDIPGFEDFRIAHSMIFNQKSLKGLLNISIHPFDYMTMSDNDYDWESCMSWRNDGGYKAGTVEMMNSPCVIVAYLAPKDRHIRGGYGENSYEWNDKKWRELFVVRKEIIAGIKDYPYSNSFLADYVMNWLRELAETNMNWHYLNDEPYDYNKLCDEYYRVYSRDRKYFIPDYEMGEIVFETEYMYNDMGRGDYHPMFIGEILNGNNSKTYIQMSGLSQCMCCGEVDITLYDGEEHRLCCEECDNEDNWVYCDGCGDRIYREDAIRLDGNYYCECCYDDLPQCDECENTTLQNCVIVPVPAKIEEVFDLDKPNSVWEIKNISDIYKADFERVCRSCIRRRLFDIDNIPFKAFTSCYDNYTEYLFVCDDHPYFDKYPVSDENKAIIAANIVPHNKNEDSWLNITFCATTLNHRI